MARRKAPEPVTPSTAIVKVVEKPEMTLEQRVNHLITADGRMDTEIHRAAVDTLSHAADTGDFTLFARLLGDVKTAGGMVYGRGVRSRRLALIEWSAAFSPIRVNGDGVIGALTEGAKGYLPFNIEGAESLPFYDMPNEAKRRTTNAPFDVAVIMGRIGSFSKAIDKAVENDALNDDEAALRQLAADVQAFAIAKATELGLSSDAAKARRPKAA